MPAERSNMPQPTSPPDIAALADRVRRFGAELQAQTSRLRQSPLMNLDVNFLGDGPSADRKHCVGYRLLARVRAAILWHRGAAAVV
jgi:hypothetical protein